MKQPHPLVAIIPLIALILSIATSIWIFGSDSLLGASQISLLLSAALCIAISTGIYKTPWSCMEAEITNKIGTSASAIVILLMIGMLSASWMISGIVPTLIYYGVQIMNPSVFLVVTCIICSLVSLMTGSSWTTIATIGVALIGIGNALGIPSAWTAGAIISGGYFGDKISPLSDTTILASTSAETDLFTHIRYMLFTTVPSILISLLVFTIAGFVLAGNGEIQIAEYTSHLSGTFHISLWTLLIPVITAIMIARQVPAIVTLFVSSLLAGICALILQTDIVCTIAGCDDHSLRTLIKGMVLIFTSDTAVDTGSLPVNNLVATSGMGGMLDTIWLIICALAFGAVMMASQMLQSITSVILRAVKNLTGLVTSTVGTGLIMNITTSDQYLSIIVTSSMFKDAYRTLGYESRLLSRTTEDAVTVTSVLIPWNTCGLTQSTVLGVPTLSYLPYCIFNYISPLMSIFVASIGWKIVRHNPS